ncbi:hypothetical protein ACH64T_03720, partial [Klebsiella pneumoniae]
FEWVHVQLHQQKGMISLSPPTICNSAAIRIYLFCQSSGWQVMRTQEQKEENTGERQTQI